jgi:hypothetical protein
MKDNKFKAITHSCSECGYRSLIKTQVVNHVRSRCENASVVTQEKIVSHHDEHEEEVFKATLYQCSRCFYTTYQKVKMNTHVAKSCVDAEVTSEKRILCFHDILKAPSIVEDHSINKQATITNSFNTIIQLPSGSVEEYSALVKALSFLVDSGKLVLQGDISALPATISKMSRDVDQRLDNKSVIYNDVVSLADNALMPAVKHSKKELPRLMTALYDALRAPVDVDTFFDNDIEWDYEEIQELRRQLLPAFYEDDVLSHINLRLEQTYDDVKEVLDAADETNFLPENMFYVGCQLLVEDPKRFKATLPDDIQKQVRLAARKYLSSLPVEKLKRANNVVR